MQNLGTPFHAPIEGPFLRCHFDTCQILFFSPKSDSRKGFFKNTQYEMPCPFQFWLAFKLFSVGDVGKRLLTPSLRCVLLRQDVSPLWGWERGCPPVCCAVSGLPVCHWVRSSCVSSWILWKARWQLLCTLCFRHFHDFEGHIGGNIDFSQWCAGTLDCSLA